MLFDQALDIPEILTTDKLKLTLMPERMRYSLRCKKSDLAGIKKSSGLKLPTKTGRTEMSQAQIILCLGPDEWLVIADAKEKNKLKKIFAKIEKDYVVSITDISHRNIRLGITGQNAVAALNVGCPLDLSLDAFPIGKTTRTVFESVTIILTRTGVNDFNIECWRSFAPYIRDFFSRIANDINAVST